MILRIKAKAIMKFKESETVELKTSTTQLSRALETLSAFANTNLGTVYFGIDENGDVVGQEVDNRTIRKITTDILSQIEPRLFPNIWGEEIQGKPVLKVELKAELLYLAGYIEYRRTGIKNMKKWMQDYELPAPKYREDGLCFVVILKRKEGT